jgi:hypothetical protein
MKITILILLTFCQVIISKAQTDVYNKMSNSRFVKIAHNDEVNGTDTFIVDLNKDQTFAFYKNSIEHRTWIVGKWRINNGMLILTNKYPSEKPLKIKILPLNDCNEYLPDFLNNKGQIAEHFFMDAKNYTYTTGGIIPYTELDSLRDSVRICANGASLCSNMFSIPYKDCYKLIIDIDIDPITYDASLKSMYFKMQKNKLIFIKSELSGSIPD